MPMGSGWQQSWEWTEPTRIVGLGDIPISLQITRILAGGFMDVMPSPATLLPNDTELRFAPLTLPPRMAFTVHFHNPTTRTHSFTPCVVYDKEWRDTPEGKLLPLTRRGEQ